MVLLPRQPPSSWVLRMNNSFTYYLDMPNSCQAL